MVTLVIYRHFKNPDHLYKVHFVAQHSENLEAYVVYETLYENPQGKYWVRPASMFEEEVMHNGVKVKRFTRLDAQS